MHRRRCLFLLVVPVLVWAQKPDAVEAGAAIERARHKALEYAKSLPDFICTETVHRSTLNNRGRPAIPDDKLTVKVSYSGRNEDHQLLAVNGKPTTQSFNSLGGTYGSGEFGSMLASIFDPRSDADFRWEKSKTEGKLHLAVYFYVVSQSKSHYTLTMPTDHGVREAFVGFHGQVEIDTDTDAVVHFSYIADQIPTDMQVTSASTKVDYAMAEVNGSHYLLPARSETVMSGRLYSVENRMEFHDYRKFASESTISFGTAK